MLFDVRSRASTRLVLGVVLVAASAAAALGEAPYQVAWTRQMGTSRNDFGYAVAADALGNAYVAGATYGQLAINSTTSGDIVLMKYDSAGNQVWLNQVARELTIEEAHAIALDAQGNIYLAGEGSLNPPSPGLQDVFLAKFSPTGGMLWSRTLGTPASDASYSVAVDAEGNAFIGGGTLGSFAAPNHGVGDPFLAKYSSDGTQLWSRQPGTPQDDGHARIAVDLAGNAYMTGYTNGSFEGPDVPGIDGYLIKYDAAGNHVWSRQTGTAAFDRIAGIAVDAHGRTFVAGSAASQAALIKHDADGRVLWQRFFGNSDSLAASVTLDAAGNVYVTGSTEGSIDGAANIGSDDTFLVKFTADGDQLWSRQVGSFAADVGWSVAVGGGGVYITGSTDGGLSGANRGQRDLFLMRFVPEPNSSLLAVLAGCGLWRRTRIRG